MNDKKSYLKIILLFITTIICGIFSVYKVGVKDGATFTLSLIITIYIILNGKKNVKQSIYIFITSMPVLVTARKLLYIDFFLMKLNFESIIIIYLFVINYKTITLKIKNIFEDGKKAKTYSYLLIIFIVASYISCIFSDEFFYSFELVTTSVFLPILLGIIVVTIFNKNDLKPLLYSLILSINLSCLYGGMQMIEIGSSISGIKSAREQLTFGYHNLNIFVNVALLVFPLLLNELLYNKSTIKEKLFLIGSILLQSAAIFLTFSRGAWLALGIVTILILFSKRYKYVFLVITLLGMLISPVMIPKIMGRGDSSSHFLENTSNTARLLSIVTSKEVMKDNILGVGYGNFNKYYRNNVEKAYLTIDYDVRKHMVAPLYTMEHAHNFFLNIGVELGIVSLIAIIGIFIQRLKACIKNYNLNRGIFVSLIIFIFIGLTTGIELNHKGVITNTYILWILFSMITLSKSVENI
ncbi:hypothetical protein UT300007_02550 [Clostridium sp. CTA-7]